jgi:hypothetical protein
VIQDSTPPRAPESAAAGQVEATFLHGGGEMGERMRAKDWAATPLGPVAEWPQSLKTAVRIMLTSRHAMFVWWGPELVNLYNDAYKAIVGGERTLASTALGAGPLRRGGAALAAGILALTGWGQEEDKRRSREAGFDHHLVKPVDPLILGQLLAGAQPGS